MTEQNDVKPDTVHMVDGMVPEDISNDDELMEIGFEAMRNGG